MHTDKAWADPCKPNVAGIQQRSRNLFYDYLSHKDPTLKWSEKELEQIRIEHRKGKKDITDLLNETLERKQHDKE